MLNFDPTAFFLYYEKGELDAPLTVYADDQDVDNGDPEIHFNHRRRGSTCAFVWSFEKNGILSN